MIKILGMFLSVISLYFVCYYQMNKTKLIEVDGDMVFVDASKLHKKDKYIFLNVSENRVRNTSRMAKE